MLKTYNDDTKVILSQDEQKAVLKNINKMMSSLGFLRELTKDNNLVNNNVWSCLGINEHLIADISKSLGYDSIIAKEIEERHKEIRDANTRIRELEQEIGQGVSSDAVVGALRLYEDIFRAWYKTEGFDYVSCGYYQTGITGEFSARMDFCEECEYPNNDVYLAMWKENSGAQKKSDDGWDIRKGQFESGEMLDTENNKAKVTNLISTAFPNARINSFEARRNDYGTFSLRPNVYIPYKDICNIYTKVVAEKTGQEGTDKNAT